MNNQHKVVDAVAFDEWFARTAAEDARMVWKKAQEYGGFEHQALALAQLMGLKPNEWEARGVERAIAFNAAQKLARIIEALGQGQLPSVDSWRDLACYAMIARRLRETKTWPA